MNPSPEREHGREPEARPHPERRPDFMASEAAATPGPSSMVRATRFSGFVLVAAGVVVLATYILGQVWEPLQHLWPWFRRLDGPIQFGLGTAAIGGFILVCSVLWERWQDWNKEKELPQGRY